MYKYLIILLLLVGCKAERHNLIVSFDISPDDKYVILAYYNLESHSIYRLNIDGTNPQEIIKSPGYRSFFSPRYSLDGKKIVFISYLKSNFNNRAVFISNSDGTEIEQLTAGGDNIYEAFFSENSNEIIYSKVNDYKQNSRLVKARAKGFDFYSINITDKKEKNISELNEYGMYEISEFDKRTLLYHRVAGYEGGMYLYSRDLPNKRERIVPSNNPLGHRDTSLFWSSAYSKRYKMFAFTAPHELYMMNFETKEAKLLFYNKPTHIKSFRFCNTKRKIIFHKVGFPYLSSINFDGSGLKRIPIISTLGGLKGFPKDRLITYKE